MYESYYGFKEKPFRITPDPNMIFPSREHNRALSYLYYGLEQKEGFVVISGDIGSGKTLLIQRLFNDLPQNRAKSAQIAAANVSGGDILPFVVDAFGLGHRGLDKVDLVRALRQFFEDCYRRGRTALLIVDEAQALTREALEELRVLSNMHVGGTSILQVFLVGQPELRETICSVGMEQLRQRILAMYHIKPLSDWETKAYVEYRLKAVGWNGDPEIEEEVFGRVYEWSEGVPRRINLVFDRLLLLGFIEETHVLKLSHVETIIADMAQETPSANRREESGSELKGNWNLVKRVERLEKMVLSIMKRMERAEAGT